MTMTENDDVGKLFVGGLSWETTKEKLQSYFSQYGEVVDSVVMKNNETGRSRGFGFVTFRDPSCVAAVLVNKPHELDGRTVDAKECTPRSMQRSKSKVPQCKVFLGGLPPDVTESDIRGAMSRFGKVEQVMIMSDHETKKCRGFGFLSFESEDSIDQACAERFVNLNGKQIECKRAEPRSNYRRTPAQPYNLYTNSQNGSARPMPSSYGSMPTSTYSSSWNSTQQAFNAQSNTYGNYQSFGSTSGAAAYTPNSGTYNMPSSTSSQYSQPAYPSYGGVGSYSQPSGSSTSYAQNESAVNYSQAPPIPPVVKAPEASSASYGLNSYSLDQSAYGPIKPYTGAQAKMPGFGIPGDSGYGNQAVAAPTRSQGYHPYRR